MGLFGPMKSSWKKDVKLWQLENLGQAFTKKHFPAVFRKMWYNVAKLENAVHGFQRSGLYPLCAEKIDMTKLAPSKVHAVTNGSIQSSFIGGGAPNDVFKQTNADEPKGDNNSVVQQSKPSDKLSTAGSSCEKPSSCGDARAIFPVTAVSSVGGLVRGKETFVSPSFSLLTVPEVKQKKSVNAVRNKLPKALSGSDAIKMMQERENKKREEEEAKQKRKEERELKRKQREEDNERKKKERKDKKRQKDGMKKSKVPLKTKKAKKCKMGRNLSSSSSGSEAENLQYVDTYDDVDLYNQCPGCYTDCGDPEECVTCTSCPRVWHISCTGDDLLYEVPSEQIKNYPFVCEVCTAD